MSFSITNRWESEQGIYKSVAHFRRGRYYNSIPSEILLTREKSVRLISLFMVETRGSEWPHSGEIRRQGWKTLKKERRRSLYHRLILEQPAHNRHGGNSRFSARISQSNQPSSDQLMRGQAQFTQRSSDNKWVTRYLARYLRDPSPIHRPRRWMPIPFDFNSFIFQNYL